MATTTRPTRTGLHDQLQAPADTTDRPILLGDPEQLEARSPSERRLPAWAWVASAFLVALLVAAVAIRLHGPTTPAAPTTKSVTTGSVTSDTTGLAGQTAGQLVDGSGSPISITGSTAVTGSTRVGQQPGFRGHVPSAHVVEHALGWFGGHGSM